MKVLFNLIIKIIDFFYQKNNSNARYDVLLHFGAHRRDAISSSLKNFKIKNTYHFIETNIDRIKNTYKETNIEIFNFSVDSVVNS
jgi:hypothetical protein